jgi:hypothetical protein
LTTSADLGPRRAVATEKVMFAGPHTKWASVEQTIGTPALEGVADLLAAQI